MNENIYFILLQGWIYVHSAMTLQEPSRLLKRLLNFI